MKYLPNNLLKFDFIPFGEEKLNRDFVIVAVPEVGLVPIIVGGHMIEEMKLKPTYTISNPQIPPFAVIHHSQVFSPFRVYTNDKFHLVFSEGVFPLNLVNPYAYSLIDWAKKVNGDDVMIILPGGIPTKFSLEEVQTFAVVTDEKSLKLVEKVEVPLLEEGFLTGPYASILLEGRLRNVSVCALLTQASYQFPDPLAAGENLKIIGKILDMEFDVSKLIENAEKIEKQSQMLMAQATDRLVQQGKPVEQDLPAFYT